MEKNDKVIIAFKLTCFSGHSLYFNINIYLFLILNISFIFHLFIIILREKFLILYFSRLRDYLLYYTSKTEPEKQPRKPNYTQSS